MGVAVVKRLARVATIRRNGSQERLRLELTRAPGGYIWLTDCSEDCGLGLHENVLDAELAACQAWGEEWDHRAAWLPKP